MADHQDTALAARPIIHGAVWIAATLLSPSPTNPRKAFAEAGIEELATSLRTHGQISPILARPNPAFTGSNGRTPWEIVAGERRWRAAQRAGMAELMTIVRDMTDFEVLEVQIVENLQRTDLHPLEEAAGYAALLRQPGDEQGYANADDLAARLGKSRSYVYQRLKLCDLQDVKAALKKAKGTPMPPTVTIQDPRTGKLYEAVKRDDLPKGEQTADMFGQNTPKRAGGHQDYEAERKARVAKALAETEANTRLLASVRQAARARPRTTDELRIVLAHLLDEVGYSDDTDLMAKLLGREHLHCVNWAALLQPMGADELALLLLDVALVRGVEVSGYSSDDGPVALAAMATLYGIDVAAVSAAPPAPAAAVQTPVHKPAAPPRGVQYFCPDTLQTWTGRGLQPAWVKAALASGRTLEDLRAKPEAKSEETAA